MNEGPNHFYDDMRFKLNKYFNVQELQDLCFTLGIDPENIAPSEPKIRFVRELLLYCHKRKLSKSLKIQCKNMRPKIEWPKEDPPPFIYLSDRPSFGSLLLRTVAFFIDHSLCFILFIVVLGFVSQPELFPILLSGNLSDLETLDSDVNPLSDTTVRIILFGAYWLYFAFMESSSWQATFGKKLLGLKVTDEEGNRAVLLKSTFRYLIKYGLFFTYPFGCFSLAFISFILATFSDSNQSLHDKIAKTFVLKE